MSEVVRKSARQRTLLGIGGAIGSGAIVAALLYARRREPKEAAPAPRPPDTD
ncbi:isopropylmalate isomerase [Sphingomonas colocasiae]|uniref:Isopropylmalate isomerase n=1 Tax=Sphingomonas colocasiae TaxID=1848973 RepID=A0ABS7PYL8_9SPHN|nr:isopropylmalate isomerase [Sphingomonas colocasiae]MBY8823298.1 isopropylmalate isomerase [Sphingomonas colocasiae]MBY8826433.1 isopropylmalate isomerase [Sphingomonas colocasiae]